MLKADGLDGAFIGVVDVDGEPLLAYSLSKVIEGSCVGSGMPLFVDDLRYASIEDAAACEE